MGNNGRGLSVPEDLVSSSTSNLLGSLIGAIVGQMSAGPEGAITGAIVGPAIEETAKQLLAKLYGRRSRDRIDTALKHATLAIQVNKVAGLPIRTDSFWESRGGLPPAAQEVFEAVLIAAQQEPEERKIPYMGNLFASIACHPEIPPSAAHWLIRTAESLSWTQFQLLAVVGRIDQLEVEGMKVGQANQNWDSHALHKGLSDLGVGGGYLVHAGYEPTPNGIQVPSSKLAQHKLQNLGFLLHMALRLEQVPLKDLEDIVNRMRRPEVADY